MINKKFFYLFLFFFIILGVIGSLEKFTLVRKIISVHITLSALMYLVREYE